MRNNRSGYLKKLLLPCVGYSVLTGAATACLVFAFKWLAARVMSLSTALYRYVAQNPIMLSVLLPFALVIGLAIALILKLAPDCKGGGIPTVVASLRGLVPFAWIKSALLVPVAALLTFLCGIPLGNEGPCVQMGAALGEGATTGLGNKNSPWRRYIMTGGACAGFAVATGAPVAGILFAIEEAHRRLSPMIFMTSSISVIAAQGTMLLLCLLTGNESRMFAFGTLPTLPYGYVWVAVPIGLICGICAIFFSRLYKACGKMLGGALGKIPFTVKVMAVCLLSAAAGVLSVYLIGTGHDLIHEIMHGGVVWYMLIGCFAVRALLLMLANNIGITGGLFIPTLTFGAIIGSLCGMIFVGLNVVDELYYPVFVIIGMAAFLGASSRIPLTACVFALEALCGFDNIFPVTVGVAIALLIIEAVGETVFSDAVIEAKLERRHKGITARIFDAFLTVRPNSFVVEKEIRDILWPATCTVLSVEKTENNSASAGLAVGDVIHVHYQSFEPNQTFCELESLLGVQDDDVRMKVHMATQTHTVPENN